MFIVFISFSHLLDHPAVPSLSARRLTLDYQVRLVLQYYRFPVIVVYSFANRHVTLILILRSKYF